MDNGGIHDGTLLEDQPPPSQMRCAERKQLLRKVMLLQAMPEFAYRGLIRHAAQVYAGKAARRLHVHKKLLCGGVGQPEPLLHEVDPQHNRQGNGRAPIAPLGIVWFDDGLKVFPGQHGLPLFEHSLLAGFLCFRIRGLRN